MQRQPAFRHGTILKSTLLQSHRLCSDAAPTCAVAGCKQHRGKMLRGVLPLLHQAQRAGTQLQAAEQQQKGRVCTGRLLLVSASAQLADGRSAKGT